MYNASNVSGLIKTEALGSVNVGLQKKVFDKKGSFRLNVTDIFYTNRTRNSVVYPGFEIHFNNYPETRIIRLNFTYNIGKSGDAMRKRNGQDEERKRIGIKLKQPFGFIANAQRIVCRWLNRIDKSK